MERSSNPRTTLRGELALWWQLARPFTLTAAVVPVLAGTAFAAVDGHFRALPFVAMLLGSALIQAGTNMFNEYFDHRRGIDDESTVGNAGTIVTGAMVANRVLAGALLTFVLALICGVYLIAVAGWPILAGGVASAISAFVYSGGPKPVSSTPFGEAQVFVFMGPVIVALAYYAQAEELTGAALFGSLPIAFLVAAILLANNIRDMVGDAASGRRTLPIMVGRETGLRIYGALVFGSYVLLVAGVALRAVPPTALVALITLPLAMGPLRLFREFREPVRLHPAVKGTALLHARFGVLYAAGIAVWALLD